MMFQIRDWLLQTAGEGAPSGVPENIALPDDGEPPAAIARDPSPNDPNSPAQPRFNVVRAPAASRPAQSQPARPPAARSPQPKAPLFSYQQEEFERELGEDPNTGAVYTFEDIPTPRGKGQRMATVEGKFSQSPGLPAVREAYEEQKRAQSKLTEAFVVQEAERAKILNETADAMEQESIRLGQMRERAMQESIAQTRRLQAQADEIGASAPQAGRLFGTGPQAASFGAALSIATGAMLSARTGGPNVALKIIDQAIARDMEVQKEAMRNKQFAATMGLNLAQEMRATFRDDLAASNAMQATLLRYTENRLEAMIADTNEPVLRARGQEAISKIQLQYAKLAEEITRQDYGLRMAVPLRQAQAMIAASAGQALAPESQQDAAAQASDGAVGQAQAATEAVGANARTAANEARNKARAGAARLKKQRQAQAQAQPLPPPQQGVNIPPTEENMKLAEQAWLRKYGRPYKAFRRGNMIWMVDPRAFPQRLASAVNRRSRARCPCQPISDSPSLCSAE